MKRCLVLALACEILVCSCGYMEGKTSEPDTPIESENMIELNDCDYDYKEMIDLLRSTGLVFRSFSKENSIEWNEYRWEVIAERINGGELEVDYVDENGRGYYQAEKVENLIMQRFDVTAEQIQNNNDAYDSKLNMYNQSEGMGGVPAAYKIIKTCTNGQTVTLVYDLYYPDGSKYLTTCTTKVDLRNNTWKYISHTCKHGLDEIFGLE